MRQTQRTNPGWPVPPAPKVDLWFGALRVGPGKMTSVWQILTEDELIRAGKFRKQEDKDRYSIGRWALRRVLSLYLEEDPAEIRLIRGEAGKPALEPPEALHFNLSHSEDLLAVAVTSERVGIDVEIIRSFPEWKAVISSILSPAESICLSRAHPEERLGLFFRYWTAKEAVLKGLGIGFGVEPSHLEVSPGTEHWKCRLSDPEEGEFEWIISHFLRNENLLAMELAICAVALLHHPPILQVRQIPGMGTVEGR